MDLVAILAIIGGVAGLGMLLYVVFGRVGGRQTEIRELMASS